MPSIETIHEVADEVYAAALKWVQAEPRDRPACHDFFVDALRSLVFLETAPWVPPAHPKTAAASDG